MGVGARGRFVRVSDSDPEMLRYLVGRGSRWATTWRSSTASRSTGPITVRFGSEEHILGGALARAMRIEIGTAVRR